MLAVYGYGEDAITYWAFNFKFAEIMEKLNDDSLEKECCLFYRPSFGRGGKSDTLFGEFDAILISPRCMYLIESKWRGSHELRTGTLSDSQRFRHYCFEWISKKWDGSEEFDVFSRKNKKSFDKHVRAFVADCVKERKMDRETAEKLKRKNIPKAESGVGMNMCYILIKAREIMINGFDVKNVILVLHELGRDDVADKIRENRDPFVSFETVLVSYPPVNGGRRRIGKGTAGSDFLRMDRM